MTRKAINKTPVSTPKSWPLGFDVSPGSARAFKQEALDRSLNLT